MAFNIAIDGPAGAGKSTIARQTAEKLGFIYIDTGAMYRALAYYILRQGVDGGEETQVSLACQSITLEIIHRNGEQQLYLNDENITDFIRTEEVGTMASIISSYPAVRAKLLELQRELAGKENVIMDGRDIGTCILPKADIKIYLTAEVKIRAARRYKQLLKKGIEGNIDRIERDIEERDQRDMNREISPLKQAEDAVCLDTSQMDKDEVTEAIICLYEQKKRVR